MTVPLFDIEVKVGVLRPVQQPGLFDIESMFENYTDLNETIFLF